MQSIQSLDGPGLPILDVSYQTAEGIGKTDERIAFLSSTTDIIRTDAKIADEADELSLFTRSQSVDNDPDPIGPLASGLDRLHGCTGRRFVISPCMPVPGDEEAARQAREIDEFPDIGFPVFKTGTAPLHPSLLTTHFERFELFSELLLLIAIDHNGSDNKKASQRVLPGLIQKGV